MECEELVSGLFSGKQYAGFLPWLHWLPSEKFTTAIINPTTATIVPKEEISIGIMLFLEKIGSWRSFITHRGGMINANGAAAITPWKQHKYIDVSLSEAAITHWKQHKYIDVSLSEAAITPWKQQKYIAGSLSEADITPWKQHKYIAGSLIEDNIHWI